MPKTLTKIKQIQPTIVNLDWQKLVLPTKFILDSPQLRPTTVILDRLKLWPAIIFLNSPKFCPTTLILNGPKLHPTTLILDCLNRGWSKFTVLERKFGYQNLLFKCIKLPCPNDPRPNIQIYLVHLKDMLT